MTRSTLAARRTAPPAAAAVSAARSDLPATRAYTVGRSAATRPMLRFSGLRAGRSRAVQLSWLGLCR